jgi:hypothetical protein
MVTGGFANAKIYLSASRFEQPAQAGRVVKWHDGILGPGGDENAFSNQRAWRSRLIEHNHRAQQERSVERFRPKLKEGRRDVGAIGESHSDETLTLELVTFHRLDDEIGEGVGPFHYIFEVEYALSQATEETQLSSFIHIAARA